MTVEKLVKRMIESALRDLKITSASPEHVNTVAESVDITPANIDKEIEKILTDFVSKNNSSQNDPQTDKIRKDIEKIKDSQKYIEKKVNQNIPQTDKIKNEIDEIKDAQKAIEKKSKEAQKKSKRREDLIDGALGDGLNPQAAASKLFALLPHTFIIGIILQSPEIVDAIIKELTRPGGILDLRFKRDIPKEVEQFLTREIQKSTQIGRRSVTIQSVDGFRNDNDGRLSSNTLQQLRDSGGIGIGKTEIGLNEKSQGLK